VSFFRWHKGVTPQHVHMTFSCRFLVHNVQLVQFIKLQFSEAAALAPLPKQVVCSDHIISCFLCEKKADSSCDNCLQLCITHFLFTSSRVSSLPFVQVLLYSLVGRRHFTCRHSRWLRGVDTVSAETCRKASLRIKNHE
jgi:hypothetical protein